MDYLLQVVDERLRDVAQADEALEPLALPLLEFHLVGDERVLPVEVLEPL